MPRKSSMSQAEYEEVENGGLDPLIQALLTHLPAPGDVFLPEQRNLWLQVLTLALQLIYLDKEPPEDASTA